MIEFSSGVVGQIVGWKVKVEVAYTYNQAVPQLSVTYN